MKITFDLEGQESALYTLYASLRMFKELKAKDNTSEQYSICAAAAGDLLEQLKESHPDLVQELEVEYVSSHSSIKN